MWTPVTMIHAAVNLSAFLPRIDYFKMWTLSESTQVGDVKELKLQENLMNEFLLKI